MNQAEVSKLMSQLRVAIPAKARKLRNVEGPQGRLKKLSKTVNALFKYERIEMNYERADEARGYAERLISDAIRYGDCHKATMEMADFWLKDKEIIHKLFKVFVPRYENFKVSYTRMYKVPREYPGTNFKRAVLELRGNPYPSLAPDLSQNGGFIHNVLLDEAKKAYRKEKYAEIASKLTTGDIKVELKDTATADGSENTEKENGKTEETKTSLT